MDFNVTAKVVIKILISRAIWHKHVTTGTHEWHHEAVGTNSASHTLSILSLKRTL